LILSSTSHVTVATGIANIWVRDATAMMNGGRTRAEPWPNRFVLGIGVSHVPLVNARGHQYERPLSAMRAYLEAMGNAPYRATMPDPPPPVLLAALGVKMLQLARERTAGAHPYFVPAEHTLEARGILGDARLLAPEHAVVFARNRDGARATGERYMKTYLNLENYRRNLERIGWPGDQLQPMGGSNGINRDGRARRARLERGLRESACHDWRSGDRARPGLRRLWRSVSGRIGNGPGHSPSQRASPASREAGCRRRLDWPSRAS